MKQRTSEEYVGTSLRCPYCDSMASSMYRHRLDYIGKKCRIRNWCERCLRQWDEVYALAGYEPVEGKMQPESRDMVPPRDTFFAIDTSDEGKEAVFYMAIREFFKHFGCLDDQHIGHRLCLPDGFLEIQESVFAFEGEPSMGRELLLNFGFVENKELLG